MSARRAGAAPLCAAVLCAAVLSGCAGSLLPRPQPAPTLFALDGAAASPAPAASSGLSLLVNTPRSAAGFDTANMAYRRDANTLEYFTASAWVDTPSRMLAPLISAAIERRGTFAVVLRAPSAGAAQWRLETQLLRLQQEFLGGPSRERVTLHATLIDTESRRPLAAREFDVTVAAPSDDARGGAVAAGRAVAQVLDQLAEFCAQTALGRAGAASQAAHREAAGAPAAGSALK